MLQNTICLLTYLLVVVSVSTASKYDARCMENGCTVDDFKNEIEEINSDVYQVMSWNIEGERVNDVCRTLSQLPDVMVNYFLLYYFISNNLTVLISLIFGDFAKLNFN